MKTKRCATCPNEYPIEDFHKQSNRPVGRTASCKHCIKAYRKDRASQKDWYARGKDSDFRATVEEECNHPSEYEHLKQDFIYGRL